MNAPATFQYYDYHPQPSDLMQEVILGLSQKPRSISPKFFYDEEGCRLFNEICATPEYYLTRTEISIIRQRIDEIAQYVGVGCRLIEPGSGNCEKVRELLPAIRPNAYFPMDISGASLQMAAASLADDFPWLAVHAICTDFTAFLELPYCTDDSRNVIFFPGSSIGNFEPQHAVAFLSQLAALAKPGGGLLIGVDLRKAPATLNAAYNDAQGITSAFNRNLLARFNRELAAGFDIKQFRHHAYYSEAKKRVEMHLVSETRQQIRIGNWHFEFKAGQGIHTENSYKYSIEEFQELAKRAGFSPVKVWTDPENLFSVHYLEAVGK